MLERHVAIKLLAAELGGDADKLERFRREARALAQLKHPHIVTVLDTSEDAGTPFMVLELVNGETLKQRLRRDGRLPVGEAIAYVIEVARALAAAHERGIVHRDVKSQNILIDADGGAKLTDFGIARRDVEVGLTQGGRVLGTTDYVSPEQALGHEVGGQSDLYSLGVVLYEALTGEVPFTAATQLAVAARHVREQLPDVQRARPEVSAALAAVVDRATAKRLERRYGDAGAMIADLERALAIETARAGDATGEANAVLRTLPPAARSQVPMRVLHPGTLPIAVVVAVLVAAAVAVFALEGVRGERGKPRPRRPLTTFAALSLAGAHAVSYNPFFRGTPGGDNASDAPRAIDGKPATVWMTDFYDDGQLHKPGVGIYVELAAPVAAARLALDTPTPGFDVQIWGATRIAVMKGGARRLTQLGWRLLGDRSTVPRHVLIALPTAAAAYRYYLVWITRLERGAPGAPVHAGIGELELLREQVKR